jgi:hypothetical protein
VNPAPIPNDGVLTGYVRALAADRPDARDMVPAVVEELRVIVRAGLLRSGRWVLSPICLGYEGVSWGQVFAAADMPDIVVDYCIHLFGGRRLIYLMNLVDAGGVVEPLCAGQTVNQFLYDRHANADECGYAVYQNTRASVHAMVEERALHPECTPIESDTPVRFPGSAAAPATPNQIETVVRTDRVTWQPDFLQTLVRITVPVQQELTGRLGTFPNANITALTTSATAAGLAPPVRDHAPPVSEHPLSEFGNGDDGTEALAHLLGVEPAASAAEARDHLLCRLEQLREAIPSYGGVTSPTRNGMRRLVAELIRIAEAGEEFVQVSVAERIGVPAQTLNGHWRHLLCLARTLWPDE